MRVALSIVFVLACQLTQAGERMQKVIYPGGRVVWEKVPDAPAPAAAPAPSGPPQLPSDCRPATNVVTCAPGSSDCPGCPNGANPPKVEAVNSAECQGAPECHDLPVERDGELDHQSTTLDFYTKEYPFDHVKIKVPYIVDQTVKTREFKQYSWEEKCCKITVCVPCRDCCVTNTKCDTHEVEARIVVRVRRESGNLDVYVYGVKGMPKEWLLYQNAGLEQVQRELNIQLQST